MPIMKDYISDEYSKWKKDFRTNSQTKSTNRNVKDLYDIILKDEMRDSDYWFFVGADHFLAFLEQFDNSDFEELVADIPNWTEDQQYILNECLKARSFNNDNFNTKVIYYPFYFLSQMMTRLKMSFLNTPNLLKQAHLKIASC